MLLILCERRQQRCCPTLWLTLDSFQYAYVLFMCEIVREYKLIIVE